MKTGKAPFWLRSGGGQFKNPFTAALYSVFRNIIDAILKGFHRWRDVLLVEVEQRNSAVLCFCSEGFGNAWSTCRHRWCEWCCSVGDIQIFISLTFFKDYNFSNLNFFQINLKALLDFFSWINALPRTATAEMMQVDCRVLSRWILVKSQVCLSYLKGFV